MSYVVNIFRMPIAESRPRNFEEAFELTQRLFEERPAPQEREGARNQFRRFCAMLTRRYPDITSSEAEALPEEELAWIDGPLDGDTDESVWNLGIGIERLPEVRDFVIESARRCRLGVRDDQAAEIYLPVNVAFSPRGMLREPDPGPRDADMPDRFELRTLAGGVERVLSRHGFHRSSKADADYGVTASRWFRREFPLGWHELQLLTSVGDTVTHFELELRTQFAPVTRLVNRILAGGVLSEGIEEAATVALYQEDWLPDPKGLRLGEHGAYLVHARTDIDRALDHLAASFESRLVPVLEQCQEAGTFDALLNPVWHSMFFGGSHQYHLGHLGSAWLARRPDFAQVLAEFDRGSAEGKRRGSVFDDDFAKLDKLLAWMHANPPPRRRG